MASHGAHLVSRVVSGPARCIALGRSPRARCVGPRDHQHPRLWHWPAPGRGRYAGRRRRRHGLARRRAWVRHRRGEHPQSRGTADLSLAARRAVDPGDRARACRRSRRAVAGWSLRGHRRARHRGPRSARDFDRRLCAGWRRGRGDWCCWRQSCACFPASSAARRRSTRRASSPGCSNIRSIRARANGRARASPTCFSRATTKRSREWRRIEAERLTRERRPDLWRRAHQERKLSSALRIL